MADDKEKKKTKLPTAQKRDIRNAKHYAINKTFKSRVRSAQRSFDEALKAGEKEAIQETLNGVYSLMDKGVKRGIYKLNKASRTKKRSTVLAAAKIA
jgi:small subunit ribosomal protein S20